MADLRIQYDEEMVGANHPTKSDTLNRLVLAEHEQDGSHKDGVLPSPGGLLTLAAGYTSADAVNISAGTVEIKGRYHHLPTGISHTLTDPGTANWQYLYAAPPDSGATLAAAQFSNSATAPDYLPDQAGWYDANGRRCIGVCYIDSSGNIVPWRQSGGGWRFDRPVIDYSSSNPPTTPTLISLTLPALGRLKVVLNGTITQASSGVYFYLQNGDATNSVSDTGDSIFGFYLSGNAATMRALGEGSAITNQSQQVRISVSNSSGPTLNLATKGFALPAGLRRTN